MHGDAPVVESLMGSGVRWRTGEPGIARALLRLVVTDGMAERGGKFTLPPGHGPAEG